jgi:hypothetical protein
MSIINKVVIDNFETVDCQNLTEDNARTLLRLWGIQEDEECQNIHGNVQNVETLKVLTHLQ